MGEVQRPETITPLPTQEVTKYDHSIDRNTQFIQILKRGGDSDSSSMD